jgi:hypothetical protein
MNKVSYFLNWMGPINREWIEKHGSQWSSGRIDISAPNLHYGDELGVSPMHSEDWNRFGDWLDTFETKKIWTLKQLVDEYEKTNPRILWLYGPPTE